MFNKKITSVVLSTVMASTFLTSCVATTPDTVNGVSQAEYDKLKTEYETLKTEKETLQTEYDTLKSEHEEVLVELENLFTFEDVFEELPAEENKPAGAFDEESIIQQLEVTEYSYNNDWWNYAFLAIKNNSDRDIRLSAEVQFYNGESLVGAKTNDVYAFEHGTETILMFMPDEEFTSMKYEFSVEEEEYYDSVISNLSYETTTAKEKEIITVTNNGSEAAEFVEGYVLFFNGETLVDSDSTYFTDDDSELKAGKSITRELDCYEPYDNIKVFFTGRAD